MRDTSKYTVANRRVPSVTECLDICGCIDFSMVEPDVLQKKADLGSRVHVWTEGVDDGSVVLKPAGGGQDG